MRKTLNQRLLAIALAAALPLFAQAASHGGKTPAATAGKSSPAGFLTDGEIRKVDTEQGKITIKHGPIENLGMPGMTMVFRVADPAMLSKVKPGDSIKFAADKVDGNFTVTRIER